MGSELNISRHLSAEARQYSVTGGLQALQTALGGVWAGLWALAEGL
jgi:hypothetical protein